MMQQPYDEMQDRKPLSEEERTKYEQWMREIFQRLGLEKDTPGTKDTPRRWLKGIEDITSGYIRDPKIGTKFPAECRECKEHELEQLVEGPISFAALCEHHVLPFYGKVWIGIVRSAKHGEVLGLSKFTRITRQYAKRFTLQERLQQEIASHVMRSIAPVGVAVAIASDHTCISSRGAMEPGAHTNSFVWRGMYDDRQEGAGFRQEFLKLIDMKP